jgi:hypothetical protein
MHWSRPAFTSDMLGRAKANRYQFELRSKSLHPARLMAAIVGKSKTRYRKNCSIFVRFFTGSVFSEALQRAT